VRGNPQALFGKRPTEKDPAKGTSPAVHFTRREAARKRPMFTQLEHGTSPGGPPYSSCPRLTPLNCRYVFRVRIRGRRRPLYVRALGDVDRVLHGRARTGARSRPDPILLAFDLPLSRMPAWCRVLLATASRLGILGTEGVGDPSVGALA
jgi:hypothetical protein